MAEKRTAKGEAEGGAGTPLRYVGDGEYIVGVPARNLTAQEGREHAAAIAEVQAATGRVLYAPAQTPNEQADETGG